MLFGSISRFKVGSTDTITEIRFSIVPSVTVMVVSPAPSPVMVKVFPSSEIVAFAIVSFAISFTVIFLFAVTVAVPLTPTETVSGVTCKVRFAVGTFV